jgi:hypothetical protein
MKCITEGCTNKAREKRKICTTCKTRKYRAKNPLKYWYDTLKSNARRRGKEFTLTLEQFQEFCIKTGYDESKGRTADSLSVDRVDDTQGYHYYNIQAITVSDNSKKKQTDASLRPEETCPF